MVKKKFPVILFFVFLLSVFFLHSPPAQESSQARKKVVVVFMTPLEFGDTCRDDLKGFSYLFKHGAAALMNTRTAKTGSLSGAYLTLGASVRAYGGYASMFNAGEIIQILSAQEMMLQTTGIFPPSTSIVNPYVQKLDDENKKNQFTVRLGALGSVLRDAGIKRAVLGNSDTDVEKHREAGLFLMDENGVVDMGDVSAQLLVKDVSAPFGLRTNYEVLMKKFAEFFVKSDVLAVDTGDFYRLEEAAKYTREEALGVQKERILRGADGFLQKLIVFLNAKENKDADWVLFVLSAQSSAKAREEGNLLSPVFVIFRDEKTGFLTSSSTRREGIVTNLDVAASILDFLHIEKPSVMLGRKMEAVSGIRAPKTFLSGLHSRLVLISRMNTPILRTLLVAQGALVAFFFFLFFTPRSQNAAAARTHLSAARLHAVRGQVLAQAGKFALLWGAGLPLLLLFLGAFPVISAAQTLGIFVVLSLAVTLFLGLCFPRVHAYLALAAATTFFITLDGMRGSEWMQYSALGFSHMGGSRYYGIGNEYMGILLGSSWIGFGLCGDMFLKDRSRARGFFTGAFCLLFGAFFCAVIGLPSVGANFGGLLTFMCALFWMLKECRGLKFHFSTLLFAFVACLCIVAVFIFMDVRHGESMSHLGRFYLDIQKKGFSVFGQTVARKMSMNLKLIQFTLWTKVLLVCGAFIVYLFRKKPQVFKDLFARFPLTACAMKAVLAGGAAGLLVNDSGIIVATTCVLGLSFTLLYLLFFGETSSRVNH